MRTRCLLPLGLLLASASVAAASDYRTLTGSTLGFTATYQGEQFNGRFARFSPQIRFDPAHLGDSRFDVGIELASANSQNAERDDMLRGSEFFNTRKFAQAHYSATKFHALGNRRFVADGMLSLNGRSRPVALTFTLSEGAKPVLSGQARLNRLDFGVGSGDWTDTELLPNAVTVTTRLLLAPATAATSKPAAPRTQASMKSRTAASLKGQSSSAPVSSRRNTGTRSP